jgi:ribosomal protein S18 acetylase RimI-like enzyme
MTPTQHDIHAVAPADVARAEGVQLLAFTTDPVMRWLWPEPHDYLHAFPRLVRGFGGRAFKHDAAHVASGFVGGTLWLPPGVHPDEQALETLMNETLVEPGRSEAGRILEEMGASHPDEPHWHLAFIGVDPMQRSRGIGAALLQHTLARIDAQRLHAYLESSNPANISLYRRHGFEVVREIRAGGSPPVFPMVRKPG